MPDQYIFIVGKSDPFSATIRAIRQAGFRVGIFHDDATTLKEPDRFDRVIPIDFARLETLTKLDAQGLSIAGLVCTYENYVVARARLAVLLKLPGLSVESAQCCTDKYLMRQAFASYNVSLSPKFQHIASAAEALRFAAQHGYPVIIKPTNLVKSLLVTRCDDAVQLAAAVELAITQMGELYRKHRVYGRRPSLIIEEYMTGQLYSVAAFADAEGQVLLCPGITELTNASEIGFDDNFLYRRVLPATLDTELESRLCAAAREGMAALHMQASPAHVELMHTTNDEVKIIEIGARIGGYRPRMYHLTYGLDLLELEIAAAIGEKMPEVSAETTGQSAVYEIFPNAVGRFERITPDQALEHVHKQAVSIRIKAQPGDICGPAKDGYKATAVVVVHETDPARFRAICSDIEHLRVELA